MIYKFFFGEQEVTKSTLGHDALASIVVFLVALPLCMGIAIACGAPPERGLVTGMIGGIIVGCLAGSPLQVSGPAASLIVIVLDIFSTYAMVPNPNPAEGAPELVFDVNQGLSVLGTLLFVAGIVQFVAGMAKVGQWFRAVAPAVVRGMLAGIGIIIFTSQFHYLVDDPRKGKTLELLLSLPGAVFKGIFPFAWTRHHQAAYTGLLTIAIILIWNRFRPDKLKILPAPLLAVIVAAGAANLLNLEISYVTVPETLSTAVSAPLLITDPKAAMELLSTGSAWYFIATLAFVASAATLLCASAVDKIHDGPRTDFDRELWSQGVGNALCGLLCALPMTGVIVRSSANVEAGGKTRLSAILHGFMLVIFVAMLPGLLRLIPTTCLAGILVYTGVKLVDYKEIFALAKYGKSELFICLATIVGIVGVDLLAGIVLGIVLTLLKIIHLFTHLEIEVEPAVEGNDEHHIHLVGAATFLRLPLLADHLDALAPETDLHVHFDKLSFIDHACLELLDAWEVQREKTGGKLVMEWHELHERFHNPQKPGRSAVTELLESEARERRKASGIHPIIRLPEGETDPTESKQGDAGADSPAAESGSDDAAAGSDGEADKGE